ncbi:MAG: hypothetical protein PHX68_04845 [Alphaproteobacteria bacterium]|nr:hypothetical protein [Alphaproteobacteria bacterium]
MKGFVFVCCLMAAGAVAAKCPDADETRLKSGMKAAETGYIGCALNDNDDDAQVVLAEAYGQGRDGIAKDMHRALLFYHLSAESGNAQSQVKLAEALMKLDATPVGRQVILDYIQKMRNHFTSQTEFKGQLLHPYSLLLLAAEKPDNKWYYPSVVTTEPRAKVVLAGYKITEDKKKTALADAASWKNRKLLEAAQEVLLPAEYQAFKRIMQSSNVQARANAMSQFKEKVAAYRNQ